MEDTLTITLRQLAHARSGDKGNVLNIGVFCFKPEYFELLKDQLTADRVQQLFCDRSPSQVVRYDLPRIDAFNFVIHNVLEGGVNSSLGLDGHGKSLSFRLLGAAITVPRHLVN